MLFIQVRYAVKHTNIQLLPDIQHVIIINDLTTGQQHTPYFRCMVTQSAKAFTDHLTGNCEFPYRALPMVTIGKPKGMFIVKWFFISQFGHSRGTGIKCYKHYLVKVRIDINFMILK